MILFFKQRSIYHLVVKHVCHKQSPTDMRKYAIGFNWLFRPRLGNTLMNAMRMEHNLPVPAAWVFSSLHFPQFQLHWWAQLSDTFYWVCIDFECISGNWPLKCKETYKSYLFTFKAHTSKLLHRAHSFLHMCNSCWTNWQTNQGKITIAHFGRHYWYMNTCQA